MNATVTRHLLIRGHVQGVGFRNYIAYKAQQLGINGWVRNRSDGSVEAEVHGPEVAVAAIIRTAGRVLHRLPASPLATVPAATPDSISAEQNK